MSLSDARQKLTEETPRLYSTRFTQLQDTVYSWLNASPKFGGGGALAPCIHNPVRSNRERETEQKRLTRRNTSDRPSTGTDKAVACPKLWGHPKCQHKRKYISRSISVAATLAPSNITRGSQNTRALTQERRLSVNTVTATSVPCWKRLSNSTCWNFIGLYAAVVKVTFTTEGFNTIRKRFSTGSPQVVPKVSVSSVDYTRFILPAVKFQILFHHIFLRTHCSIYMAIF